MPMSRPIQTAETLLCLADNGYCETFIAQLHHASRNLSMCEPSAPGYLVGRCAAKPPISVDFVAKRHHDRPAVAPYLSLSHGLRQLLLDGCIRLGRKPDKRILHAQYAP